MRYQYFFLLFIFAFVSADVKELQVAGSGFFGATFEDDPIPEDLAYEIPADAIVKMVVAGSPAENAGIKSGDLILAVDGFGVDGAQKFVHYLARKKSGTAVECFLLRNDEEQDREISKTIVVTLGAFSTPSNLCPPVFGIELKKENEKFLIHKVLPGSAAYKSKLQSGDQILSLDGNVFSGKTEEALADFLRGLDTQRAENVMFTLFRQNQEVKGELTPNRKGHIGLFLAGSKGLVLVDEVFPNGPAKKAGLMAGDQIQKIGEEAIRRGQRVGEIVVEEGKGAELILEVKRGGEQLNLTLIVGGRVGY